MPRRLTLVIIFFIFIISFIYLERSSIFWTYYCYCFFSPSNRFSPQHLPLQVGITESFQVKRQVLLSASKAAEMILRVHNILKAAPRKRAPDHGHC